jgi:hypothetical protein
MCDFTLHRRRQISDGEVIGQKQRLGLSFEIRLLEFNQVMILQSEGPEFRAEFLHGKSMLARYHPPIFATHSPIQTNLHDILVGNLRHLSLRRNMRSNFRPALILPRLQLLGR